MTTTADPTARRMWRLLEPLHAVTYFAPEAAEALRGAGLKGFWMGYFAARAAPMGPVGPAVVEATFYNFAPALVRRALPDAWGFAPPASVLEARLTGVAQALGPLIAGAASARALERTAELALAATEGLSVEGRPLAAANLALAPPDEPLLALWQAATVLREHRGDGHVATLVESEVGGCEAHVVMVGTGVISRAILQAARGWSDDEWTAAAEHLRQRGLLDSDGGLTDTGRSWRRGVEDDTDRLAAGPWSRLGDTRSEELAGLLAPMTAAVVTAGLFPVVNPIGLDLRQAGFGG
ncbi:MAG TPA: hypothetical protein VMV14_09665 [Acidimicrobiales bacterium]|nr:hypothetical protein [Acidimicrobiales bacterium]